MSVFASMIDVFPIIEFEKLVTFVLLEVGRIEVASFERTEMFVSRRPVL